MVTTCIYSLVIGYVADIRLRLNASFSINLKTIYNHYYKTKTDYKDENKETETKIWNHNISLTKNAHSAIMTWN